MGLLRVGVIGLGVGEQHVRGYLGNAHCQVTAVCDYDPDKLQRIRDLVPTVRTTTAWEAVATAPDIELVSIASYDEDHFPQICAAIDHGKHVFVEKPLCQTLEQLATIKEKWSAARGEVKFKSNLVLRRAPIYQAVREQIHRGELGRIYAFDGDYLYGRLVRITDGWRANTENYSVIAGGAIHLIDLMVWMTGERPTTVATHGNRICTEGTRFRYHDYVTATLTFPSGMIGRITANFGCVHGHQHVVRVFGTAGTFLNDDLGSRLQQHRDPAPPAEKLAVPSLPESKYVLIDDFVAEIRGESAPHDDPNIDFDVMSICISTDESLCRGATTEIAYA